MTEDPDATRIHLAAHDPMFPAARERGFLRLAEVLAQVLQPRGFSRKGQGWAAHGATGRAVVHLGRDRFGWAGVVSLRWCAAGAEEDEEVLLTDLTEPPLRLVWVDLDGDPALTLKVREALEGPGLSWLDLRRV